MNQRFSEIVPLLNELKSEISHLTNKFGKELNKQEAFKSIHDVKKFWLDFLEDTFIDKKLRDRLTDYSEDLFWTEDEQSTGIIQYAINDIRTHMNVCVETLQLKYYDEM